MYNLIRKFTKHKQQLKILQQWTKFLPPWFVLFVSCLVGWTLYLLIPSLRKRVKANMRDLLPAISEQKISHLSRAYFCNLSITFYEILIGSGKLTTGQGSIFAVQGEEHLEQALSYGRGAIVFTPHMGNFFYYYWYLSRKYPCITVATADSEELRPLYLLFQQLGCKGLDYDLTPPLTLLKTLRQHLHANGVIFLLGDFWRPHFPPAKFFGKHTRSPRGTAIFALEQQVPVVPFYGYREKGFRHRLNFGAPVFLHQEFEPRQRAAATHTLNQFLEEMIEQVPAQWFYWFNVDERWEIEESQQAGLA